MAIHALWEDRYALSVRKQAVDLSELSATATGVSVNNEGTFNETAHHTHFKTGEDNIIGQLTANSGTEIFGLPITGNPGITTGQETIEVQKTDGYATQRVGGVDEASDVFRAGQSPSASFDFIATGKSLISFTSLLFQNGQKEIANAQTTTDYSVKIAKLPSNLDGSEPAYYATFIRKISSDQANSHYLADAVATSVSFRASQTEPLTVSGSLNGRIMGAGLDLSAYNNNAAGDAPDEAVMFSLDGKRNYLLQDSVITFEDTGGNDVVMACESFDLTVTSEVTPNRFNTFFPLNMVLGNYTVEGSFTVPMLGKGGSNVLNYDYFMDLLTDAGSSGNATTSSYTPKRFTVNWITPSGSPTLTAGTNLKFADTVLDTTFAASGTTYSITGDYSAFGTEAAFALKYDDGNIRVIKGTIAQNGTDTTMTATTDNTGQGAAQDNELFLVPWSSQDIMMRSNTIITDVSVGGSTEATMTVSFRSLNKFTAGTDTIIQDAFFLGYQDDTTVAWGYEDLST